MDIYKFFLSERDRLVKSISVVEKGLNISLDGYAVFNSTSYGVRVYLKTREEKRRYIPQKEYKEYLPYIKKAYLKKQLKYDRMYLEAIDNFLKKFNPELQSAEEFLQENEDIANVLCMKIHSVSKKAASWFEDAYESSAPFSERRIIKTIHGEMVRSKSECMIADSLFLSGLPYRYEWGRDFCGNVVHPDFIIMHPVTGKFIIWEHLGLADYSDYLQENIKKLEIYAKAGFIAGKNLIITTESAEHPLDSDTVNLVIKRFLS